MNYLTSTASPIWFIKEMDLFNHLLGSEGCNVDGTVGSNPFTSLVDNVFENQFVSGPGFQSSGDGGVYFVDEAVANNGAANASQVLE